MRLFLVLETEPSDPKASGLRGSGIVAPTPLAAAQEVFQGSAEGGHFPPDRCWVVSATGDCDDAEDLVVWEFALRSETRTVVVATEML